MLFSSVTFLYAFLPIVLILYFLAPKKLKNAVLLVSSLFFYYFGERTYTVILFVSSIVDYTLSLLIEKYRGQKKTKLFLICSLMVNLGMLGFFKYSDFFIGNINALLGTEIPLTGVPLPIGISFYTFQTMSYTIDVYRGTARAQRNLVSFATFVCLFPQLIAGPIVRYTDIQNEIDVRKHTFENVSLGLRRFTMGLGKKVILANGMGEFCKELLALEQPSVLMYWLYAIGFSLQIYLDFSAYSDMAIGLGKIFGFNFPENFNYPFISKSITEFWRRWHMTLGTWFRDYVYFPLGGSRTTGIKWLRNILVVWMITGFWHGAEWNFVLWGLYFGVLLALEKMFLSKYLKKCPAVIQHIYLLFTVLVSFVIFSVESLGQIGTFVGGLFGIGKIALVTDYTLYVFDSFFVLLVLCVFASMPFPKKLYEKIGLTKTGQKIYTVLEPLTIAVILVVCTAFLVDGSFNPFLYFRF